MAEFNPKVVDMIEHKNAKARVAAEPAPNTSDGLNHGGGGGTFPPVSKDENLKGRVDLLQALVMLFIAALIALAVGVMTTVGGVNTRIDGVQKIASDVNREVGALSVRAEETNRRLEQIEKKLDAQNAEILRRLPPPKE